MAGWYDSMWFLVSVSWSCFSDHSLLSPHPPSPQSTHPRPEIMAKLPVCHTSTICSIDYQVNSRDDIPSHSPAGLFLPLALYFLPVTCDTSCLPFCFMIIHPRHIIPTLAQYIVTVKFTEYIWAQNTASTRVLYKQTANLPETKLLSWWCHQMETVSVLLAISAGNSLVPGEFPTQRPVTWSFDVFFDLRPDKWLSIQSWGWWFETPSHSLWRHCNAH